ncbi:peptide chain release factor N(5)-glutamine methyltransferase [Falsarthrobacter nasiphocae]|uniref:Release factor glutamine methyltransferase n=1 Tax=Falsarthrobacter nasiphocae TaxID=189863 RepID=A0AAE4C8U4_9MICC|nr:peptide chain release factor N(5)-glutamine methyltransferase [Falsarthrobacter nasiphocae]MDR6892765.1 release factor glutamine methyltransferase [Falsarthrobacter nasiphocae]
MALASSAEAHLPGIGPGVSVREAHRAVERVLREAGVDSPGHDARALTAAAVSAEPRDLILPSVGDRPLTDEEAGRLTAVALRRRERVPLQHVLGTAPFRRLELQVGPGCLVPRPETELLVDLVLERIDVNGAMDVIDLGTGSGAIAAAVAQERPQSRVTAVDISPEALAWAARNLLGTRVRLIEADATAPSEDFLSSFDVVVANPPYVPDDDRPTQPEAAADPAIALYGGGADGLRLPLLFAERAAEWLRPGGFLVMEHGERQGQPLREALTGLGFEDVRSSPDLTGRERMTHGVLRHGRMTS